MDDAAAALATRDREHDVPCLALPCEVPLAYMCILVTSVLHFMHLYIQDGPCFSMGLLAL